MGWKTLIYLLPNILTVVRILLVPLLALPFQFPTVWPQWTAFAIFVLAGATDYLDGFLARRLGAVSDFGSMLDPIADKMLVLTAIALLLFQGTIPLVPSLLIICREVFVSGLREYLGRRTIKMPVSMLAKWKTAVQFIALGLLLANDSIEVPDWTLVSAFELGSVFIWIAASFTVVTGYGYCKVGFRHVVGSHNQGAKR